MQPESPAIALKTVAGSLVEFLKINAGSLFTINNKLKIFLCFLFLAALAAGYFYPVLGGRYILTERDLAVFFIPPRLLWVDIIRNGEFPLWNPYSYSGHPLFATLQPGVLYPLNLMLLVLPFDMAFNWSIVVHFLLAGIFTFLLMRELKASIAGSLMAALTFMLSGYLFSVHNVISTLFTVTWSPFVILLFLKAMRKGSIVYSVASGPVLTVMFLGGGIEALFLTCVFLFFLTLLPSMLDFNSVIEYPYFGKRLFLALICFIVFLLTSAVQLLPFLELANQSTRAGGLSFFEATTWSFDFKDFIQFFIPDPYGYASSNEKYWSNQSWIKTVYTGAVPFILSVFFLKDSKRKALPFIMVALFSLFLAMGKNNLFYHLIYDWFPFFKKIRYPVKFLFLAFLFLSLSAGFGYDRLKKGMEANSKGVYWIIIALLAVSTVFTAAFGYLSFYNGDVEKFLISRGIDFPEYNHVRINVFNTKRLLFFFIVFSVFLYSAVRIEKVKKTLPFLMVSVLSIDLFFAHNGFYTAAKAEEYHKKGAVMESLTKDPELFRAYVTPRTRHETIEITDPGSFDRSFFNGMDLDKERLTGYNLEHRVFDTAGVEVMRRGDYESISELIAAQKSIDSTNLLSMLNVKYVISLPRIDSKEFELKEIVGAKGADLKRLEGQRDLKIYENLNYAPRFNFIRDWKIIKKPKEYLDSLQDKNFNPSKTVLLEEEPFKGLSGSKGAKADDEVKVLSYRNNSSELKVRNSAPGLLLALESFYPGWRAYVDGKEARILKADYLFRGVPLTPGEHTVKFVFRPWSFIIGAWISSISLIVILSGAFYLFLKRRRTWIREQR